MNTPTSIRIASPPAPRKGYSLKYSYDDKKWEFEKKMEDDNDRKRKYPD